MKNVKTLFLTTLLVLIAVTTTSAKGIQSVSKNYSVKYFSSINANTIANIVYTQSDIVSVRVDGVQEMIDHLKIKVHDGVLIIENDIELNSKNDRPIVIFISSPALTSIETYGIGDLCLKGEIKNDHLTIKSFGIGRVHALNLQSEKISVEYDAIGDLRLGGTTQIVEIFSSGVGNIDCKNLLAKTAMVRSTKSGKVNCFASENIGLYNEGIGDITYHGSPSFKSLNNGGLGKIREIE
ncbi:MAG: DUF2807 domain-containing protein [Bacteroidales bacterium]|nr:DUF2807 domain-containing protein [Bacteroidales bacterium]